ncbi:MAG: hypothetical protein U0X40_07085 [Ferruginibacter sp.]
MKRRDLVQLVLVIMAIICGYRFITLLPSFLLYLLSWFGEGVRGGFLMQSLIGMILQLALYSLLCIFLVTRSRNYAAAISDKAGLSGDIQLSIDKTELLYAVFIGLGIYGLIEEVPTLIKNTYSLFIANEGESVERLNPLPSKASLAVHVLTSGLFFVLVYYARVFAEYAGNKIHHIEPHDELLSNL